MILLIGYLAAVIDVGQFAPQLWRTLRRQHDSRAMSGISRAAYAIATAQAILWVIYGFSTNRLPIALPNLVIAPSCAVILALAHRSRPRDTRITA